MTAIDAMRFLAHEAEFCRSRDEHEALCLLLPGLMRVWSLEPMTYCEADFFRREFRAELARLTETRTQKRKVQQCTWLPTHSG